MFEGWLLGFAGTLLKVVGAAVFGFGASALVFAPFYDWASENSDRGPILILIGFAFMAFGSFLSYVSVHTTRIR